MKKDTIMVFVLAGVMLFSTFGTAILIVLQDDTPAETVSSADQAALADLQQQADPLPVPEFELPEGDVKELATETITAGDGAVVKASDTITVNYHGVLATDGTVFDSSYERGEPITFSLDGVIEGWQEGIPGMKVGETRQLNIPSAQAYGESGSGAVIGPDADLVFIVELLGIE